MRRLLRPLLLWSNLVQGAKRIPLAERNEKIKMENIILNYFPKNKYHFLSFFFHNGVPLFLTKKINKKNI
jgi:hypothetical protein